MTKNICIYTLGRSGSNYLRSFIDMPYYTLINEPFTLSSRHNASQFITGLGLLYEQNKIHLPQLKDLLYLTIEMQLAKGLFKTKLLTNELLILWFNSIQEKRPTSILWKFMAWYDSLFSMNIVNIFDNIDYLILNYRKNILKQWISSVKATTTGEWITEKESINIHTQIQWNKTAYLNFVAYTEKHHNLMRTNFMQYDKPKTVICYEELSSSNNKQKQYLQNLFQKSNIDLEINDHSTLKQQSDSNKPIEDNFLNKQEFLDDYNDIKDTIVTQVVFD